MTPMEQVTELRKLEEKVRARRAAAEANLALVEQQFKQTEDALRALGVDPDAAEQELATLQEQFDRAAAELTTQLKAELASCEEVMRVTSEALK